MSRSQTKCLIGSALGHIAVVAVVLFGAAFVSKQKRPEEALPLLQMMPSRTIEELLSGGGGNPEVAESPAQSAPANQEPTPAPTPVEPVAIKQVEPTPPAKAPEPEPPAPKIVEQVEKIEKVKPKKPTSKPQVDDPKPQLKIDPEAPTKPAPVKKHKDTVSKDTKSQPIAKPDKPRQKPVIDVELTPQKSKPNEMAATLAKEKALADAKAKREHERAIAAANDKARQNAEAKKAAFADALQGIKGGLSQSTKIEMPGPGGEAYANYGQTIRSIYEQAWHPPSELEDDSSTVEVQLTLSSDGTVLSSSILTKSGSSSLNRSVQDALNRVRRVPSFPEGAKDSQRTFRIKYNLRSKRQIG